MERRSFLRLLGAGLVAPAIPAPVKYFFAPDGGWSTDGWYSYEHFFNLTVLSPRAGFKLVNFQFPEPLDDAIEAVELETFGGAIPELIPLSERLAKAPTMFGRGSVVVPMPPFRRRRQIPCR